MPLKLSAPALKPRPAAATSIPGMLSLLQNEWDALMLELHSTKTQLETTRQVAVHPQAKEHRIERSVYLSDKEAHSRRPTRCCACCITL